MSAYVPASAQAQQSAKCFNGFISAEDLADCRRLADAGDTEAMLALAEGYARGFLTMSRGPILLGGGHTTSIPPDQNESLRYYKLADEMGGDKALRQMFEEYKFGGTVPKNEVIADQYLHKAAHHGSEWAILLLAQLEEKSAPATAIASYLRLARNDNCIAQMRLAEAYASGVLVKKNLTQAYFWLLLAKVISGFARLT